MRKIATDLRQGDAIIDPSGHRHVVIECRVIPGVAVHFRTDTGADIEHSWDYARASTYRVAPRV